MLFTCTCADLEKQILKGGGGIFICWAGGIFDNLTMLNLSKLNFPGPASSIYTPISKSTENAHKFTNINGSCVILINILRRQRLEKGLSTTLLCIL